MVVPGGGIRTRNHPLKRRRNPCLRIRPTRLRSIVVWLRGQDSNPDFLVQSQAWCRLHYLASVFGTAESGRRDSNSQPPAPRAGALPLRHVQPSVDDSVRYVTADRPLSSEVGTDGRIRTDTGGGLSAVPLPVGLRQRVAVDRAGVEPAPSSLQGSHASSCATGPWSRGRESNPPHRAYETPLISRSPALCLG